jgi:hypothetical protein
MLLALESPMIYFDFDILPKEDRKLGQIQARQGFLVAENDKTGHNYSGITNSENAISDAGKVKIMEFYNEVKSRFQGYYPMLKSFPHYVYEIIEDIINYTPLDEVLSIPMLNYKDFNKRLEKKRSLIQRVFGFKTNGGEVDIQYDNSWMKGKNELYTEKEVEEMDSDNRVATSMQKLSAESISNGEHMYRN